MLIYYLHWSFSSQPACDKEQKLMHYSDTTLADTNIWEYILDLHFNNVLNAAATLQLQQLTSWGKSFLSL